MPTPINREKVISNKETALRSLNRLLDQYINDPDYIKKANLISYWINSYVQYIDFEEKFDPARLIRYPRGSVIRINFGFNVGNELGGLHFAVVIDNNNKRNGGVLTVIPLSSTDGKEIHPRNVDLGIELFQKINDVQRTLYTNAQQELVELQKANDAFTDSISILEKLQEQDVESHQIFSEMSSRIENANKYRIEIKNKQDDILKTIETIKRNNWEILKLKKGSMALVNQITTVSKQRILTPKHSEDFLYGIRLSTSAMEKINDKIKELYIYE